MENLTPLERDQMKLTYLEITQHNEYVEKYNKFLKYYKKAVKEYFDIDDQIMWQEDELEENCCLRKQQLLKNTYTLQKTLTRRYAISKNLFLSIKKEVDDCWKTVFDDKIACLTQWINQNKDLIIQNYHKYIGLHQKVKDMKGKFEEQKYFRHYQNMVVETCKLHDEFIEIYNT